MSIANVQLDAEKLRTPITDLFKIQHPVILAGMNVAAGPKLAAAVSNAGGLGVIGGLGYTPDMLREQIAELKSYLTDKNAPFGVDLLLPQVGGNARKTKYVASPHITGPRSVGSCNHMQILLVTTHKQDANLTL